MKNKWLPHIVAWLVILVILTLIYSRYVWSIVESFYFVGMLLPVVITTNYFFNNYLVPKYLLTRKYFLFGLYSLYMIIISLNAELLVVIFSFIILANYNYENLSPMTTDVFGLTITLYSIVLIFSFVKLIKLSFSKEETIESLEEEKAKVSVKTLIVTSERKKISISYSDILYIESLADYVKIHLREKVIITKEKISALENLLSKDFIRIHRSYIINRLAIESFNKEEIELKEITLPISRKYKTRVHEILTEN